MLANWVPVLQPPLAFAVLVFSATDVFSKYGRPFWVTKMVPGLSRTYAGQGRGLDHTHIAQAFVRATSSKDINPSTPDGHVHCNTIRNSPHLGTPHVRSTVG